MIWRERKAVVSLRLDIYMRFGKCPTAFLMPACLFTDAKIEFKSIFTSTIHRV